jgi:hypothetical protein
MDGLVDYQGRMVPKESFRAFIFNAQGEKKIVNSWDDYEAHLSTNEWFNEVPITQPLAKEKSKRKGLI